MDWLQWIITGIIVAAALGWIVRRVYNSFGKRKKCSGKGCDGCRGCG
ncbi:MAG: FeoB-associated Cys-rich membrane protein [Tannerellaceae bacterium]|nr:FeoB-associated Cys-rich membrane protein [Tannerellaceae bacterium]